MKRIYCQIVGLLLILSTGGFGQDLSKSHYWGIRAGYLRALTDVTNSSDGIQLGGVAPRNSFYGGVFYQRTITPLTAYRVEVNYQQKGVENQDLNGNMLFQQRFHYVGITPLIGITPLAGLSLLVGPEANLHVGRSVWSDNAKLIELGVSGRIAYRYKWIGVEVGYFNGLTKYTIVGFSPETGFGFTSRVWQAGLSIVPAGFKNQTTH